MTSQVRHLEAADAAAFHALRREALLDTPLAFGSSPEDDRFADLDAVHEQLRRGPEAVIIGAFLPSLVGCVGVYRDPHVKFAHRAHVWGMYVAPAARRQGLGTQLIEAAVAHARTLPDVIWVQLGVSAAAPVARRLYERAGFREWGIEPEATRYGDRLVDEHHLALRLR
ncbi:MAG: GNAT family N-acetyltransferase [Phycisphaerales bacterium]|nr:GNAT family N-acetyltransferase [Phycisphaerales bacterium]